MWPEGVEEKRKQGIRKTIYRNRPWGGASSGDRSQSFKGGKDTAVNSSARVYKQKRGSSKQKWIQNQ